MRTSASSSSQFQERKVRPWSANQPRVCRLTIVLRFRDPDTISTPTSTKPIASSYDTICADARSAPRKAYFELEAQPATITPYTPIDVTAITYSRPALMSASTTPGANGITAHAVIAGIITIAGAVKYRILSACVGAITSLNISFKASAIGCRSPQGPT